MLRRVLLVVPLAMILLIPVVPRQATAAETKVIDTENVYGGKTILTTYSTADQEYKLTKKLEYQDGNGVKRKVEGFRANNQYNELKIEKATELYSEKGILQSVEVLISDEKARVLGYYKVITSYNPEGLKTREEIYYNKSDFQEKIYSKSIDYFREGEKYKSEYYLAPQESKRTGYYKLITIYKKGKMVDQQFYDKEGRQL